jgi:inhibitor of cysteine peptidase
MKKFLTLRLAVLIAGASLVLSGCASPFALPTPRTNNPAGEKKQVEKEIPADVKAELDKQSQIKKFKDYEELAAFLEDNQNSGGYSGGYGLGSGALVKTLSSAPMEDMAYAREESGAAQKAPAAMTNDASSDYSKTNIQVAGVDEADIVKTDGEYVYAIARNSLYIVKAYPAEKAEVLAKIEFKSRPQEMYISGDRLAVIGANDQIYTNEFYKKFRRQSPYSFLKIFDISNRRNPKQVRDLDFEGNYFNSRLIGDQIYFVSNNYNYYFVPGEPVVPRLMENGEVVSSVCSGNAKCFAPEVYYFDIPYDSYNFTLVSSVNIKTDDSVKGDVYVLSGGQNMYVSPDNIYIAYTKYISEYQLSMMVLKEMVFPKLSAAVQEKVKEIEAAKNYILNENEKMNKISAIVERYEASLSDEEQANLEKELAEKMKQKYQDISKELEKTVIHKIGIKNGDLEYKTFGEVTGSVLNQFSMDESGDYFRIATTKNRTWSQFSGQDQEALDSYSNLYVLDKNLKVVGAVEKIAPGERIYSVRFMQNRAYMVTAKQTDPLFVIDVSSPAAPKILGELKMPGYSSYLHPYDDKYLIGIGKDTAATEWGGTKVKGLKISLYDVSDVANPKVVKDYIMGDAGSDSLALNDHKAFLFDKEKNLLAIPVTISEDKNGQGWGTPVFNGAAVFKIDETGIELKGKIDHSDGGKYAQQDCWWGWCYYDNNVQRLLYIGNTLYSMSNQYLKANNLSDLKELKNLELKKERNNPEDDIEIIN